MIQLKTRVTEWGKVLGLSGALALGYGAQSLAVDFNSLNPNLTPPPHDQGKDKGQDQQGQPGQDQSQRLTLTARLNPVNSRETLSGRAAGVAVIRIHGNEITAQIQAQGVDPSIMHMAHIHKGDHCPSQSADDKNHDGVLDVIEGLPAYGPVLVNFGADISSLAASAKGGAPMANAAGVVNYRGSGSYTSLVADLHNRAAMDPATGIAKLAAGERFRPEMGVIVVHGIRSSKGLPAGAQTLKGSSPQMSLPILCGRLRVSGHGLELDTELE